MSINRRLLLALAPLLPFGGAAAAPVTSKRDLRDPFVSLRAFVDVLVPRDDMPSAGDLNIQGRIIEKATAIDSYYKLLIAGCRWLDGEARTIDAGVTLFRDLEEDTKIRVVQTAEQGRPRSVGLVFFRHVRNDTMLFYYSHPEVWRGLGFDGPPQPDGFLDFDRPPRPPAPRKVSP